MRCGGGVSRETEYVGKIGAQASLISDSLAAMEDPRHQYENNKRFPVRYDPEVTDANIRRVGKREILLTYSLHKFNFPSLATRAEIGVPKERYRDREPKQPPVQPSGGAILWAFA